MHINRASALVSTALGVVLAASSVFNPAAAREKPDDGCGISPGDVATEMMETSAEKLTIPGMTEEEAGQVQKLFDKGNARYVNGVVRDFQQIVTYANLRGTGDSRVERRIGVYEDGPFSGVLEKVVGSFGAKAKGLTDEQLQPFRDSMEKEIREIAAQIAEQKRTMLNRAVTTKCPPGKEVESPLVYPGTQSAPALDRL
ncbi:MAG: hypothetical protein EOM26_01715 [Alphaproteobacteria bacterium]|nr:hypothetical protein [Alphaproteobacteria bacterium]